MCESGRVAAFARVAIRNGKPLPRGINLESCQGRRSGERVLECTLRFLVAPAFDDESPEQSPGFQDRRGGATA